jgi:hypothetical protein
MPRRTLGKWRTVMVAATRGTAAVTVGIAARPALTVGSPVGWAAQNGGTKVHRDGRRRRREAGVVVP